MKILMLIVMFFVISALFIISEKNISFKQEEGQKEFTSNYYSWMNKTFENSKSLAGYVAKMNWLPD